MAFLFDTEAISELLRLRPAVAIIDWLIKVPREEQFTSSVGIGELYKEAYRSLTPERHLNNIEQRILPAVTVLPYDTGTEKIFGRIRALLEEIGTILPDADIQIAATAITHNLELITANIQHGSRISELKLNTILEYSRSLISKQEVTIL